MGSKGSKVSAAKPEPRPPKLPIARCVEVTREELAGTWEFKTKSSGEGHIFFYPDGVAAMALRVERNEVCAYNWDYKVKYAVLTASIQQLGGDGHLRVGLSMSLTAPSVGIGKFMGSDFEMSRSIGYPDASSFTEASWSCFPAEAEPRDQEPALDIWFVDGKLCAKFPNGIEQQDLSYEIDGHSLKTATPFGRLVMTFTTDGSLACCKLGPSCYRAHPSY